MTSPDCWRYLEHPAHGALAALFFESFEEALLYDFELKKATRVRRSFEPELTSRPIRS